MPDSMLVFLVRNRTFLQSLSGGGARLARGRAARRSPQTSGDHPPWDGHQPIGATVTTTRSRVANRAALARCACSGRTSAEPRHAGLLHLTNRSPTSLAGGDGAPARADAELRRGGAPARHHRRRRRQPQNPIASVNIKPAIARGKRRNRSTRRQPFHTTSLRADRRHHHRATGKPAQSCLVEQPVSRGFAERDHVPRRMAHATAATTRPSGRAAARAASGAVAAGQIITSPETHLQCPRRG